MKKLHSALMLLILLLVVVLPVLPFLVGRFSLRSFSCDLLFALLFSLIIVEKIYAMILRQPDRNLLAGGQDWTAVAVGLAYVGTMYAVAFEFFGRGTGLVFLPAAGLGAVVYGLALGLRYWALHHLGRQWAVQLDQAEVRGRSLVRTGPYALMRHPLYLGACLECLAIPLMFNAFWAFWLGLIVFVPLEIKRAGFEEKYLRLAFGREYEEYAHKVKGFFVL